LGDVFKIPESEFGVYGVKPAGLRKKSTDSPREGPNSQAIGDPFRGTICFLRGVEGLVRD